MLSSLLECLSLLSVPGTSPSSLQLLLAGSLGTTCIIRAFFPFKLNPPRVALNPAVPQQHSPATSPSSCHSFLPDPASKSFSGWRRKPPTPQWLGMVSPFAWCCVWWPHPCWVTVPSGPGAGPAMGIGIGSVGNATSELDRVQPNTQNHECLFQTQNVNHTVLFYVFDGENSVL